MDMLVFACVSINTGNIGKKLTIWLPIRTGDEGGEGLEYMGTDLSTFTFFLIEIQLTRSVTLVAGV